MLIDTVPDFRIGKLPDPSLRVSYYAIAKGENIGSGHMRVSPKRVTTVLSDMVGVKE